MMQSFGLLEILFLALIIPSILFSLHSLVQTSVVKMLRFFSIDLPFNFIIRVVIFIKPLLLLFMQGVHDTWRVEFSSGLKIRLPAV